MKMLRIARLLGCKLSPMRLFLNPFLRITHGQSKAISWSSSDARDPLDRLLLNGVLIARSPGSISISRWALSPSTSRLTNYSINAAETHNQ